MLFPTVEFGLFFIIVFAVSSVLIDRMILRSHFLLAASYFFYGWWDWRFCGLLALNAVMNYAAARLIEGVNAQEIKKILLGAALALNLAILAVFKYLDWFLQSLSDALIFIGLERDLPLFNLVLPVGISFFTFQGISYVVDVYRGQVKAERSLFDVALYISFFPQLVAGPIVRAADFLPQLKKRPVLTTDRVGFGMVLIVVGLFKKMIVANYLATLYVDDIFFDPLGRAPFDLLFGVYGYAVQIYCDFSGYSDIAIGIAALLGYHFSANFNQPYRATSMRDFWRRWHLSLSTWLRDYLYIPLGGSKGGRMKTARNLLLTMLLGGIWHGAAWTFVIWGMLHGLVLVAERAFARGMRRVPTFIGVALTFHLVCLAWIFFRSETLQNALSYGAGLFSTNGREIEITPFIFLLIAGGMLFQFTAPDLMERAGRAAGKMHWVTRTICFNAGLLAIQWISPDDVAPFIYFRF